MLTQTSKKQAGCISLLLFAMLQCATEHAMAGAADIPTGISDVYSDIDMRIRLSAKSSAPACTAEQCAENLVFDARVQSLGRYLRKAAAVLYPQHEKVITSFNFEVAEKQDAGTASNNRGLVVVFRGIQDLQLSDDALGFVIAREMAHVIAGHHVTNTSTKLVISALASVLFPAVAIIGASSAAAQASTATSLITSAASTATSMVGSEVAMAKMKPTQLSQADEIARTIMEKCEWNMRSAESVLTQGDPPRTAWMLDLQASQNYLLGVIEKEDAANLPLVDDAPTELAEISKNM